MLICVILAGGRGTRLIPLTDTTPKPLLKAGGKTLLEWNMDNVVNSVDKFVIVISYLGEQIVDFIGQNYKGKPVEYVWQINPKGGTLDAFRTSIFENNSNNLGNSKSLSSLSNSNSNSQNNSNTSFDDNYLIIHADDVHGQETFDNLFAKIKENPAECYLSAKVIDKKDARSFGMFEVEPKICLAKLIKLEKDLKNQQKEIIVDCLIQNQKNQILVQKRSNSRKIFPNCWDFPGGHLEFGDTILETIHKEILEETGLENIKVVSFVGKVDWILEKDGEKQNKIILQFLVKAENIQSLRLEEGKATEFCWVGKDDNLEFLKANRSDNFYIHETLTSFFDKEIENAESKKLNLEFSEFEFVKIVEKPDYFVSNLANIAISYFPNKVLEFVPKEITNLPIGQKEAYITDLFNDYSAKYPIQVVPTNAMWLPVTSIEDLKKTDQILQNL